MQRLALGHSLASSSSEWTMAVWRWRPSLKSRGQRARSKSSFEQKPPEVLLVTCACAALIVANAAWADAYHGLLASTIAVAGENMKLSLTVHRWINDGRMALFVLLVGLEIKREVLAGELLSPRQAALPIAAAIGGVFVPASIYFPMNDGGVESRGWAIPMPTDIAFALGVLALVAPRAPNGLKIFLERRRPLTLPAVARPHVFWDNLPQTKGAATFRCRQLGGRAAILVVARLEDRVLFKAGLVLLISWLLGVFGAYDLGQLVHLQLLIGLMCLLLGTLRARDAAIRPNSNSKR